ncbi:MAG: hypothetical protein V1900_04385 [Candidatus Aenigmatarchaeota archaeon]
MIFMTTTEPYDVKTPAYSRVIPTVGTIQDAARMLLEEFSKEQPQSNYAIATRVNVITGVANYFRGLANPIETLREIRDALPHLPSGENKHAFMEAVDRAKTMAFFAYRKSKICSA